MKTRHLIMTLALLLTMGIGWAQKPMFARKAASKLRKELKLNRAAPAAAQRIQPAAAEEYSSEETIPRAYYKYDAWGNETEYRYNYFMDYSEVEVKDYRIQTWDNSHGYPVLLDKYYYEEYPDGTKSDPEYECRTTLNAAGVRVAMEYDEYGQITLDKAGHVTSYGGSGGNWYDSCNMTWNGEMLATFKYDYSDTKGGYEEEHLTLNNIQVVHQTKLFNAYELDYYEMPFSPEDYGVWINATGTYEESRDTGRDPISGALEITSEVSADKKTLTTTAKVAGNWIKKNTVVFTDDNGSYTERMEYSDGGYEQKACTYNEYGDLIKEVHGEDGYESINWYEWEYDNGKPLWEKFYWKDNESNEEHLSYTLVFTAWHDGSSIRVTASGEPRILGATLYTLDGTKVRILSAEEAQAAEAVITPQNGIYILAVQTDRGMQTRKIVSVK